jgi:hypothetical protein
LAVNESPVNEELMTALRGMPQMDLRAPEKPEIVYYRLQCSFSYGMSLTELDDKDEFVQIYERDLPQMRGAKP